MPSRTALPTHLLPRSARYDHRSPYCTLPFPPFFLRLLKRPRGRGFSCTMGMCARAQRHTSRPLPARILHGLNELQITFGEIIFDCVLLFCLFVFFSPSISLFGSVSCCRDARLSLEKSTHVPLRFYGDGGVRVSDI